MPLVDPVSQGKSNDWMTMLMGKTLGDTSNETTFAKKDLPQNHRTYLISPSLCLGAGRHQPNPTMTILIGSAGGH
jgi:hypothetical protein